MTIIYATKICPGTRVQPLHHMEGSPENFTYNSSTVDGLSVYCRGCACFRQKEWRDKNKDKKKAARKSYYARTGK